MRTSVCLCVCPLNLHIAVNHFFHSMEILLLLFRNFIMKNGLKNLHLYYCQHSLHKKLVAKPIQRSHVLLTNNSIFLKNEMRLIRNGQWQASEDNILSSNFETRPVRDIETEIGASVCAVSPCPSALTS